MPTEFLQKPNLNYPLLTKYDNTNANRTIITDINSRLITSIVTSTELSYLSGVTSNIRDQINTAIAGGFKYNSTNRDPTLTDDSSGGYTRCSLWVNNIDNFTYKEKLNVKLNIGDYVCVQIINKRINQYDTQIKTIGKLLDLPTAAQVEKYFGTVIDETGNIINNQETNFI